MCVDPVIFDDGNSVDVGGNDDDSDDDKGEG